VKPTYRHRSIDAIDPTLPSAVNFAVLHNTVANDRHTSPTLRSSHLEVLGIRTGSEVI
jgi:hypothetical protein